MEERSLPIIDPINPLNKGINIGIFSHILSHIHNVSESWDHTATYTHLLKDASFQHLTLF